MEILEFQLFVGLVVTETVGVTQELVIGNCIQTQILELQLPITQLVTDQLETL